MKVHLRTFGCRANQYDTEQIRALCERAGADTDASFDIADVAILNSCAVTSAAEADLRQTIRRLSRERPGIRIVVTGCAAARSSSEIEALPGVTAVIPGADLDQVAQALGIARGNVTDTAIRQLGTRAVLRVQDGCDEHCTFCATTLARDGNRSRSCDDIVAEASRLADHHQEIVLTGVHVGSWGKERGTTLGSLLRALVLGVPRVRFRLASVEATEVDPLLAELLRGGGDRVCPYLHAPLQSGSDSVLKRMGRNWYTARTYQEAIQRLTDSRSTFGLGADVMSGFPGETDGDHAATLDLIRELPFTHLHVFPYSARPGTAAPRLAGAIPSATARERAAEIREVGELKSAAYAASRVGGFADVIVLGGGPERDGLTEDYLPVRVSADAGIRGSRFSAQLALGHGDVLHARASAGHRTGVVASQLSVPSP